MVASGLEILDWPDGAPSVLSARRAALNFPVSVKTLGEVPQVHALTVKSIAPMHAGGKAPAMVTGATAQLALRGSGDQASGDVSLKLDRGMPPGTYLATLDVVGTELTVSFTVVPDTSLRIRPGLVVLDAATGNRASAIIGVESRGNVPLIIDLAGTYPLGREESLAAVAGDPKSALEVLMAALNRAPRVLTEAGALQVEQPDGPLLLPPAESATVRIDVRWECTLDPARRYRAFLPLYGADVELAIVAAAKHKSTKPVRSQSLARGPKPKTRSPKPKRSQA